MKPVFLISDTTVVVLALIPSVFGVITLLVQAAINARVKRVERRQTVTSEKTMEGVSKIDKIALKQDVIHKQIDGRMEDLIKINKEASEAIGKLKGIAEQKEKQANGHKNGEENSNQ